MRCNLTKGGWNALLYIKVTFKSSKGQNLAVHQRSTWPFLLSDWIFYLFCAGKKKKLIDVTGFFFFFFNQFDFLMHLNLLSLLREPVLVKEEPTTCSGVSVNETANPSFCVHLSTWDEPAASNAVRTSYPFEFAEFGAGKTLKLWARSRPYAHM